MSEILTFVQYYRRLRDDNPAKRFINEIASLTQKSPKTVKQWLTGKQRPDKLTIRVISEYLNIAPEVLFPLPESELL